MARYPKCFEGYFHVLPELRRIWFYLKKRTAGFFRIQHPWVVNKKRSSISSLPQTILNFLFWQIVWTKVPKCSGLLSWQATYRNLFDSLINQWKTSGNSRTTQMSIFKETAVLWIDLLERIKVFWTPLMPGYLWKPIGLIANLLEVIRKLRNYSSAECQGVNSLDAL